MLLELTEFHRHKLLAAVGLSYFLSRADGTHLKASVRKMEEALRHWKSYLSLEEHIMIIYCLEPVSIVIEEGIGVIIFRN